ncbi:hypothetical protein GCK72_018841 [Caenorhabditis remanei]|uniref:CRE-POS-1 protein n=2 Tax=Caenorhabditis remanei TaxID=31234 RepID=E3LZS9_CAERE|nr:hypothetical protein GCK72_018841 [Caenorhabditis remanei]EFO87717.1 CRE-POS-1 protein [Caenorhabditis remanei]KAF1752287.1 hypothetical protein GCK72_018841 [Caenorhabditis remanei]
MTGSETLSSDSILSFKKENYETADSVNLLNQSLPHITAPPGLSDLEKSFARDFQPFVQQDQMLKTLVSQAARNALASQDPCTIPDDLREELMRQKRKDDAFKTALCDSYKRNQTCSYGDQCRFAHGVHELRLPQHPRGRNHPKYKTVLCDKFSTTGNCKYGTRCQFIHKLVNPTLLAQASGMLNNTSTLASATFNQSLFMPPVSSDLSMDLNQSLPIRQSDLARAFARANQVDSVDDSVTRMARIFGNQFHRNLGYSGLRN